MIPVAEALERVLALREPVPRESVPLAEGNGRWTASPVTARRTQPSRDLSAMDGYAIRFADMPGPWRIVGESAAGSPADVPIASGEAVRIFTGAALPDGVDTILIQEDVSRADDVISLSGAGPGDTGEHVRARGSDFITEATLIEAGDLLTPARLALATTAGVTTLDVRRRVRVAIISTGDELVHVGVDPGDDRLPASNALMLAAMLAHLPVDIRDYGIVPDDKAALTNAFRAVAAHDIIVTSGGASVGDHDLVRPALTDAGAALDFWKIAMRPGKPLMAGMLGDAVVLGLPGNPVSAFVTATLFLKPLIARLSGAREPGPAKRTAPLGKPMPAVGARADYVRGIWRDHYVVPLAGDSGMLVPLARAEVLIIRPAGAPPADEGDTVEIITLA